jgi:SAM-dependent methyltransferase
MLDWTKISGNPNDSVACAAVSDFLVGISKTFPGIIGELVLSYCAGKKMLDIGAGEHDISYFNEKWEHAIYKRYSSSIVAVEIDKGLCDFYNQKGFDFRCVDATSDIYLGEKFDFIYCGDVIEHVENTVQFMRFVDRHMEQGAICMITTPNPFFEGYLNDVVRKSGSYMISNLEHMGWITPNQMLEILRRAKVDLQFDSIFIPEYASQMRDRCVSYLEKYFSTYVYILKKN